MSADFFSSPLLWASKTRKGKLMTGSEREKLKKSLRKLLQNGPAPQQAVTECVISYSLCEFRENI